MAENVAEGILRKMVQDAQRGGYFGLDTSDDGASSWLTVDLNIDVTADELAYLRQVKAAVERDRETDR